MLERFLGKFTVTDGTPRGEFAGGGRPLQAVLGELGGCTFEHGLYRVHTESSALAATQLVAEAFPEFRNRLSCFAFDWLGRQFATDNGRGVASDPEVMMFEPGTGEALEIPVPLSRLHDEELVDYSEEALAVGSFSDWMSVHRSALDFDQCAGYRTPLFLGGEDAVSNLEVSDLDVYWTLMGQLRLKAMTLPLGTPISEVQIEEQ